VSEGTCVAVLAAGRGTRMRNDLPKVLHPLAGFPLIAHVLRTAAAIAPQRTVVVLGHGAERVRPVVADLAPDAAVVVQKPQLGTGHAVQVALEALPERGTLLVLYGDTPLLRATTLQRLLDVHRREGAALTLLAIRPEDPGSYGRIVVDAAGVPSAIVEARHAPPELLASNLCNSGVLAAEIDVLRALLPRIPRHPEKGEYYLTELVRLAREADLAVAMVEGDAEEGLGANSQAELADLEARIQRRLRRALLERGVIMSAPESVYLALDTEVGPGARIEPHVVFGPRVRVGEGAVIRSFSHIEGAEIAPGAEVGPFARLRPGARIGPRAKVGNFVEIKNATLGPGARANHLSYLGDAEVKSGANIGAGTITCNYDGFGKHRTEIGEGAFIGSNTALVAPVRVGARAIVGAGSVIVRDVPEDALAVARGEQRIHEGKAPQLRERFRRRSERPRGEGGA